MDLKTKAIVLRRTNYGEADRILQVLTPEGKFGVLARGVRKEKSKLAGGIELFSVSEIVVHRGRGDLGILTSARLTVFYAEIMKNYDAMTMMGKMMKEVAKISEQVDSVEFFNMLEQTMLGVNNVLKRDGGAREISEKLRVIRVWWEMNLAKYGGGEANLHLDAEAKKFCEQKNYKWDEGQEALVEDCFGKVDARHIKMMRIINSCPLDTVLRVKGAEDLMDEISQVAKCVYKTQGC